MVRRAYDPMRRKLKKEWEGAVKDNNIMKHEVYRNY